MGDESTSSVEQAEDALIINWFAALEFQLLRRISSARRLALEFS